MFVVVHCGADLFLYAVTKLSVPQVTCARIRTGTSYRI